MMPLEPTVASLVTRDELYRALWIQGAGIVAIPTAPGSMPAWAGLRFLPIRIPTTTSGASSGT